MATPRRKKAKNNASRFRTGIKILILLLALAIAAVWFTERKQWPETLRDHAAVKKIYAVRDEAIAAIKPADDKDGADSKPIRINAPQTQKPEPGYTKEERGSLEDLMRKEGVTP